MRPTAACWPIRIWIAPRRPARIAAKLKRPIGVTFHEEPLQDVVDELGEILDEPVLVDKHGLEEASIAIDAPVLLKLGNVPIGDSLNSLGLECLVQDDAVLITTRECAERKLEVRLHSGRGVLYERPVPANNDVPAAIGRGGMPMGAMGMGGGGGMGGGMMGGGAGGGFLGGTPG